MQEISNYFEDMNVKSSVSRKKLEDFMSILKEWALHEEFYSIGMERILKKLELLDLSEDFLNFHAFMDNLVEKSTIFAEKLQLGITNPISEFLTNQCNLSKKVYIDSKKICEFMTDLYENSLEIIQEYYQAMQDCEKIAVELDREKNVKKKEKLLTKLISSQKELQIKYKTYQETVASYNSGSIKYQKSMEKIVDAYNYYEKSILQCYENIFETLKRSFSEKLWGLSIINSTVFEIKTPPIEFFPNNLKLPELILDNFIENNPLFTNKSTQSLRSFSLVETSGLSGLNTFLENIYKEELNPIINKAWEGKELSSSDYELFNSRIKEKIGRNMAVFCLNLKRSRGIFQLDEISYTKIGELLFSIVNECERFDDIITSKNIIILSQTFFKKNNNDKDYLQNTISEHPLWKKISFWENALRSTIFEELAKQKNENFEVNKEIEALNNKSLIFCQLVSFGNIMISFKIDEKIVSQLISKFAENYKFTKNETKEITAAISESINKKF